MDSLIVAGRPPSFIENLMANKMTDFQIHTHGYVFNVHRIVVAATSKYFQLICAGDYKESNQGYVTSETEPELIAALLVGLYTGQYVDPPNGPFISASYGQKLLDNALQAGTSTTALTYDLNNQSPAEAHVRMYTVADYYQAESLCSHIAEQYKAALENPDFKLNNLLNCIELLYNNPVHTTNNNPTSLLATTIYKAQRVHTRLIDLPCFIHLLATIPAFAIAYTTKYHRANWIWCPECKAKKPLQECQCGFNGLCGYEHCTTQNFAAMTCTLCGRTGHMLKGMPAAEQTETQTKLAAKSLEEALLEENAFDRITTPASPNKTSPGKKRKRTVL